MYTQQSDSISVSSLFAGSVPNAFNYAREVGHYSVDVERQIHFDRSLMRYYVPRSQINPRLDLNVGFDSTWTPKRIHISAESLLKWIAHERFQPVKSQYLPIVCTRGAMQEILCTPYFKTPFDHWIICASRLDDVIYLKSFDTEYVKQRDMYETTAQRRMRFWGCKFEQYMTADRPNGIPDVLARDFDKEKFYTVVSNKIGENMLLVSAEVDGVKTCADPSCDPSNYVEMKTSKLVPLFTNSYWFKSYKTLKWWAQSIIVGINDNICGLRDDAGIVQSIQTFQTSDLKIYGQGHWSPDVCLNFCNNFLLRLKTVLNKNNPSVVYKFEYMGGNEIHFSRTTDPNYEVISEWYNAELQKHKSQRIYKML